MLASESLLGQVCQSRERSSRDKVLASLRTHTHPLTGSQVSVPTIISDPSIARLESHLQSEAGRTGAQQTRVPGITPACRFLQIPDPF